VIYLLSICDDGKFPKQGHKCRNQCIFSAFIVMDDVIWQVPRYRVTNYIKYNKDCRSLDDQCLIYFSLGMMGSWLNRGTKVLKVVILGIQVSKC
jgi:hypothetical protein